MKAEHEMGETNYIGTPGHVPVSHAGNASTLRRMRTSTVLLRIAAVVLCAGALATMVTDKETHVFPALGGMTISKTAEYDDVLALKAYVYTNGVVVGYCILQLVAIVLGSFAAKAATGGSRLQLWATFIVDQMVAYGLLAVASAATEVAYIAKNGEPNVLWGKQCDNYGRFCKQVGISVVLCFLGVVALCGIAAIAAKRLFSSDSTQPTVRKDGYYTSAA